MIRIKVRPVLMSIPEAAKGDDWDIEIEESLFHLMQKAAQVLRELSAACNQATDIGYSIGPVAARDNLGPPPQEVDAQVRAQSLLSGQPAARSSPTDHLPNGQPLLSRYAKTSPPASQIDPVIDTTVRDSEMRAREHEMSLEEFLEPPERTRSAPRPRAHSWRHGNG